MKMKQYVKKIKINGEEKKLVIKAIPFHSEIKALGDDEGVIEAYVSVFGNVDSYGDIVEKGAFTDAVKAFNTDGRYPKGIWAHDWALPIAKTLEMREDERGLYIKAKLILSVPEARKAYDLIKAGVITDFSFGYEINDGKVEKDGYRHLYKLTIYEWSPVLVGANNQAMILDAKSAQESGVEEEEVEAHEAAPVEEAKPEGEQAPEEKAKADSLEGELDDRAKREAKWNNFSKINDIMSALYSVYFQEETEVEKFPDLVKEAIALLTAVVEGTDAGENSVKAAIGEEAKTVFAKEILRLETDVKETELKAGRVLSAKNIAIIKAAIEAIDALDTSKKSAKSALEELLSSAESDPEKGKDGDQVEPVITKDDARVVLKTVRESVKAGNKFIVRLKQVAGEK
jgi:HK97 family phage prohead protease